MTPFLTQAQAFVYAAIFASVPLLLATIGEILIEKAGNLNLGVEGMMYLGAIMGFLAGHLFGSAAAALLFAAGAGMAGALIYAFLTVTLKANQNVTGLTLSVFGAGIANFIGENLKTSLPAGTAFISDAVRKALNPLDLGALSAIPVAGKLLFSHSILAYLALLAAVAMSFYLSRTRQGLNLRAVGENPAAADAMGVDVSRYKYLHILAGGGLCGLGGAYVSMVVCVGNWQPNIIGGQGWIALALVIFSSWKPLRAIAGSLLFGALSVLRLYIPRDLIDIPGAFFLMLPFAVTCVVLVASSIRMRKENQQPGGCGVNYFREER